MGSLEAEYDDAMYAFSTGDFAAAAEGLRRVLAQESTHFEAQLALGMVLCRLGDYAGAIREGHRAEQLRPQEQLVHTNLSLFYVKAGDKVERNTTASRRASPLGGATWRRRLRRRNRTQPCGWRGRRQLRRANRGRFPSSLGSRNLREDPARARRPRAAVRSDLAPRDPSRKPLESD